MTLRALAPYAPVTATGRMLFLAVSENRLGRLLEDEEIAAVDVQCLSLGCPDPELLKRELAMGRIVARHPACRVHPARTRQ